MTTIILSAIIGLLLGIIGFLCWKLYVTLTIIAVFETDLADNITALDNVEHSMEGIIQLRMFFDSKDIQILIKEVMDNIKLARLQVGKTSKRFTDRSKNKYYLIEEINAAEPNDNNDDIQIVPVNRK